MVEGHPFRDASALALPSTSPELLAELTEASVAALAGDRDVLFARHAGNLRKALRELYDCVGLARAT